MNMYLIFNDTHLIIYLSSHKVNLLCQLAFQKCIDRQAFGSCCVNMSMCRLVCDYKRVLITYRDHTRTCTFIHMNQYECNIFVTN